MNAESLFSLVNLLALIGWILLLFSFRFNLDKFIIGIIITLLSITYIYLIFTNLSPAGMKSFNTLAGVKSLFSSDWVILAGWVHYLTFDLMTGLFIKNSSQKLGISWYWVVPCLFCTFLLGPMGLLLYLLIRIAKTRKYFLDYL